MAAAPTFSDNFSNLSLWNGTSGTWMTDYFYHPLNSNGGTLAGNGEQEWYINNNDPATSSVVPWTVKNGILTITAQQAPASIQPLINGYQYTSGMINTHASFSQTYGFFEMRSQLPAGQGTWPAFWLLPESGAWPPEIDAMEVLGNDPATLYTSIHSGTASNEINGGGGEKVADTSKAYHEFAVDWTPSTITWYFDNKPVLSEPTPSDMVGTPMYMIANLAMGGGWPGNVDSTTPLPAQMRIANIQAYASNPLSSLASVTINATGAAGQVYLGQPGNDIFNVGTNAVIMTGDGLTNTYVFSALPTSSPSHITDFDPGADTINLVNLLQSLGYTGSNPIGDGTISWTADGHGGTDVLYNHAGASTPIVDLDNVAPSAINSIANFVFTGTPPSGGTSSPASGPPAPTTMQGYFSDGISLYYAPTGLANFVGSGSHQFNMSHFLVEAANQPSTYFTDGYSIYGVPTGDPSANLADHIVANLANTPVEWTDGFSLYKGSPAQIAELNAGTLAGGMNSLIVQTSDNVGSGTSSGSNTNATGETLTADGTLGQILTASTPNDTFIAGQNSVMMTEDGGANTFVYTALPYNAGHITNFNPTSDTINVASLLHTVGYAGSNPFSDGTLSLSSDGNGGTNLYYNPPGAGSNGVWPTKIVDLDHLATSSVNVSKDFVLS